MFRKLYILSCLVLMVQLTGCASAPPEAQRLAAATRADVIVLDQDASYERMAGVMKDHWRYTALRGTYRAEKENASGVFYRGEGRPIVFSRIDDPGSTRAPYVSYRTGGIWVPKDSTQSARLYFYFEAKEYSSPTSPVSSIPAGTPIVPGAVGAALGGAIVNGIIQSKVGEITFYETPLDMDFSSKIVANIHSAPQ